MQAKTMNDIRITPGGRLLDDLGTFAKGNGEGLVNLVLLDNAAADGAGYRFFRRLMSNYLRLLSSEEIESDADVRNCFLRFRPSGQDAFMQSMGLPPLEGAEYFRPSLLLDYYSEFEEAVAVRYESYVAVHAGEPFSHFLQSVSPAWENVGKVIFHLAENKNDETRLHPFAFLSSFVYRVEGSHPKHLPLAAALKLFEGNKRGLEAILSPIAEAAQESEFLCGLLESRRLFRPMAWTVEEAFEFLQQLEVYERAHIVVRVVNLWKMRPPQPKVTIDIDTDRKSTFSADALINFSVNVSIDGEPLTSEEIEELIQAGRRLVRIRGQWVQADAGRIATLLEKWHEAQQVAENQNLTILDGLRMLAGAGAPDCMEGAISAASCEECEFKAGSNLAGILSSLENPAKIPLPELPDELSGRLRGYQRDGVAYLWRTTSIGLGACLADDMGLGKTLQVLSLFSMWKREGILKELPVLVVLPATLLSNWREEAARFTAELRLVTLHSSVMESEQWTIFQKNPKEFLKQYDVALVSYGMLTRLTCLTDLTFPAAVADEAQAIKNPNSRQSRHVRELKASRRIALTGTPVENKLTDLWSIFDFINPGLLGSLEKFQAKVKELDDNYGPIRQLTRPFILRRLKTDKRIIRDLPDKTEVNVYCSLSRKQAALYGSAVRKMQETLAGENTGIKRNGLVLSFLTQFKQICNHPAQYLGDDDYSMEFSGKFQALAELAETIAARQEKMLVFTQYREMTVPLHELLKGVFGRDGLILHGSIPVRVRPKLVEDFQREDGPPFFVLSLKAAGTGLNLTAASHVVHFDRWWNPAVENQASDRAFRIGQKKNVLIHKFICRGTLEDKIDGMINDKKALADQLLAAGAEKLLTSMSNDELMSLIKLELNETEGMQ